MARPTIAEAEEIFEWGVGKHGGGWVGHSQTVARAARVIAEAAELDGDRAYVLGLLHDIGRYTGIRTMRHVVAGYELMTEKGFDEVAKICITHTYPEGAPVDYVGPGETEARAIETVLQEVEYDDYDRLIAFCDLISERDGVSLIEQRLIGVVRRYGYTEERGRVWDLFFGLKEYWDEKCGRNVYELFREEIEGRIFGENPKPAPSN